MANTNYSQIELEGLKRRYIQQLKPRRKALCKLKILSIWFENGPLSPVRCEKVNKYNPLTWALFICVTISIVLGAIKDAWSDTGLKTQKY